MRRGVRRYWQLSKTVFWVYFFFPSQRPKYLHIIRVLCEAAASQDTEGELPPFPLSTLLLLLFVCLISENFYRLKRAEDVSLLLMPRFGWGGAAESVTEVNRFRIPQSL